MTIENGVSKRGANPSFLPPPLKHEQKRIEKVAVREGDKGGKLIRVYQLRIDGKTARGGRKFRENSAKKGAKNASKTALRRGQQGLPNRHRIPDK